jgi:hypothetical protein
LQVRNQAHQPEGRSLGGKPHSTERSQVVCMCSMRSSRNRAPMTPASRRSSGSTAGSAPSASSAETEDHSGEPASTRLSLTAARGEAPPLVSARPGSGRSRFADPRRRTRLEGPAQAKAAIRPHDSVQNSSPTSLWKLWKSPVVEPQAHAGVSSGAVRRLYDARPGMWSLERGRC